MRMSLGEEMPSSGQHGGCTNGFMDSQTCSHTQSLPSARASSRPVVHAKERGETPAPLLLWAPDEDELSMQEAKDSTRGPFARLGEAALPEAPTPRPRSWQPQWGRGC